MRVCACVRVDVDVCVCVCAHVNGLYFDGCIKYRSFAILWQRYTMRSSVLSGWYSIQAAIDINLLLYQLHIDKNTEIGNETK